MPAQVHHPYTWSGSQTNSSEESKKWEMTYLMQFCIMTALFVFIMVVITFMATFFHISPPVFDEEKPMHARTGML
jgi:hypothetical protein